MQLAGQMIVTIAVPITLIRLTAVEVIASKCPTPHEPTLRLQLHAADASR